MNVFCASENLDTLTALRSSPNQETKAENSDFNGPVSGDQINQVTAPEICRECAGPHPTVFRQLIEDEAFLEGSGETVAIHHLDPQVIAMSLRSLPNSTRNFAIDANWQNPPARR